MRVVLCGRRRDVSRYVLRVINIQCRHVELVVAYQDPYLMIIVSKPLTYPPCIRRTSPQESQFQRQLRTPIQSASQTYQI